MDPPPPLVDPTACSSLTAPASNVFSSSSGVTPTSTTSSPASSLPPDAILDALTASYPALATLSLEQVKELLQDPHLFDAYFNTTPQALQLHRSLEQALQENLEIAQKNEALRPRLQELRDQTMHHFQSANELKDRWQLLDRAQADHYQRFLPATQQARLSRATHAQEYTSEALVNAFLDGQIDDQVFVQQYRAVREVYHRRAIGLQKWQDGKVSWR
ncbi:BQ5605_C024g09815 [Microbotryum silenes-dioicae]|uniref:BQ5605_C024g09815 protein n=1 Tax=Microbotryum silenes-dioicae TaxID=796604 RepID=A0A2X0MLR3_9BASI|nr:BQ5605_C024g09815 [Microbotryum silenes-dioicae]